MKTIHRRQRMTALLLSALLLVSVGAAAPVTQNANAASASISAKAGSVSVSLSAGEITKGQSVTIRSQMTGGSGTCRYAYYYKKSTSEKWSTIKPFSTAASVKVTPSAAVIYDIKVIARDGSGTDTTKLLTLKVSPAVVNNSKVSKSEISLGDTVTLRGIAKGGSGTYTYAYFWKRTSSSSWGTIKNYSSDTTADFKPAAAVDYDLMVKVKDSHGVIEKKTFSLKVFPKLVNQASVTPLQVEKGSTIEIKANPKGGSGHYTYSYSYKKSTDTKWQPLSGYTTADHCTITMNPVGQIQILIKIKDSTGSIASKTVTVTVSESAADAKVDAVLAKIITPNMSDFDKVKAIHDWLLNNVAYDENVYTSAGAAKTSYTVEGLLDTGIAVCDGYAKTFLSMAQRAGLEANRVTGQAISPYGNRESHAWNQVKADGQWYNVDVTWDDPVVSENYGDNRCYTYFMVPDSAIAATHFAAAPANPCTAEQPVDQLLPLLLAEEEKASAPFLFCDNDTNLPDVLSQVNGDISQTTTIVCRTDKSLSEIFAIIKKNPPSTTVGYSLGINGKEWKLNGYVLVAVRITTVA